VKVSAHSIQTVGWLFAISPDVAELLAVVTLRNSALGSVCLHPDSNVAEAWQTENFLGLCRPRKVTRDRGRLKILDSSGGDR
jgi:hypothetical protein